VGDNVYSATILNDLLGNKLTMAPWYAIRVRKMKITSFFFIFMLFIVKAKNKVKRINKIVPLAK